jgi:hypothetical protein
MTDARRTVSREIPHTTRLMRDHGSLCISTDGSGKNGGWFERQLLVDCTDSKGALLPHISELSRSLQHADPATLEELARGYRLAIDAGLISENDPRTEARREEKIKQLIEDPNLNHELMERHGVALPIDVINDVIELVINHPLVKADTHA